MINANVRLATNGQREPTVTTRQSRRLGGLGPSYCTEPKWPIDDPFAVVDEPGNLTLIDQVQQLVDSNEWLEGQAAKLKHQNSFLEKRIVNLMTQLHDAREERDILDKIIQGCMGRVRTLEHWVVDLMSSKAKS